MERPIISTRIIDLGSNSTIYRDTARKRLCTIPCIVSFDHAISLVCNIQGGRLTRIAFVSFLSLGALTSGVPFFLFLRGDVDGCVFGMPEKVVLHYHRDSVDSRDFIHDYFFEL